MLNLQSQDCPMGRVARGGISATVFDQTGAAVGWEYRRSSDDATESYGPDGQILRIAFRNGDLRLFTYSDAATPPAIALQPDLLVSVADQYGRCIQFRYDSRNRIVKMIDPAGSEYVYGLCCTNQLST
jgi:uncharacterized protein RhaS with RHS repeats